MSMALTKADMAESLFNELGLNKREARELSIRSLAFFRQWRIPCNDDNLPGFPRFVNH